MKRERREQPLPTRLKDRNENIASKSTSTARKKIQLINKICLKIWSNMQMQMNLPL